jgi:hypothetical protein
LSEKIKGFKVDIIGSDEVALLFKNIDLISERKKQSAG